MFNFNHERLGICVTAIRSSRVCYEVAMKYGALLRSPDLEFQRVRFTDSGVSISNLLSLS
jgi:alkylation response protein AidB-like acyl-CoA dehydrogenase